MTEQGFEPGMGNGSVTPPEFVAPAALPSEPAPVYNAAPPEAASKVYVISGLWRRLIAFLLDLAVVGIIGGLFGLLIPALNSGGTWASLLLVNSLFLGVFGCAYFIVMTRLTGQTLGKMIMGIRVVRLDGAELDWGTVVMRELVGRSISQLLGSYLGYLTALFTGWRQAPHDMIVDTCVVYDLPGHSSREVLIPQSI